MAARISLNYRTWHWYKHAYNIIVCKIFAPIQYIIFAAFVARVHIHNDPKLIITKETLAALLIQTPKLQTRLRQKKCLLSGPWWTKCVYMPKMGYAYFTGWMPSSITTFTQFL